LAKLIDMKKLLAVGDRVKVLCPIRAGNGVIIKVTKTGYAVDLDRGGATWTWHCYVIKIAAVKVAEEKDYFMEALI